MARSRKGEKEEDRHIRRQLPDSSREALTWIAEQLRRGYTGSFELDCREGGVRRVGVHESLEPNALKHR